MADLIDSIEGQVLTHLPQVDTLLLAGSILRAVQTFCEKTLVLEHETDPRLDLVADTALYTLPAVENRTIVKVKRGEVWRYTDPDDGKPKRLDPTNPNELDGRDPPFHGRFRGPLHYPLQPPSEDWRISKGTPSLFFQPRPDQIRLVPIPRTTVSWGLKVTYHLKPSNDATEVDDFVIDQWREQIVIGTLADVLQIKHKPWTDLAEGKAYENDFVLETEKIIKARESSFESQNYTVGRVRAYP